MSLGVLLKKQFIESYLCIEGNTEMGNIKLCFVHNGLRDELFCLSVCRQMTSPPKLLGQNHPNLRVMFLG